MVALATRSLDRRPVQCNARELLHRAYGDVCRGALLQAGVLMREAARVYLVAECQYWGCLPNKKQQRSTSLLIKALKRCEECKDFGFEWLEEVIEYSNQLCHAKHVDQMRIETCLSAVHMYLDCASYLIQPKAAGRLS